MLNPIPVSAYIVPPPILTAEPEPQSQRGAAVDRLQHLQQVSAKGRAALEDQKQRFEQLYHEASQPKVGPEDLEVAAGLILEQERRMAEKLLPQIGKLEANIERVHRGSEMDFIRSARQFADDALEIARTWLELYQNLRIRMLKLASDRLVAGGERGSPIFSDANEMEHYLRRISGE
jgi:hypothetical protein